MTTVAVIDTSLMLKAGDVKLVVANCEGCKKINVSAYFKDEATAVVVVVDLNETAARKLANQILEMIDQPITIQHGEDVKVEFPVEWRS